jgi:hypothetical protein
MSSSTFLLLNLALAFYNVGTIWAHEVDIFRTWKLVDRKDFHHIQGEHWRRLPYWVFLPIGLALVGSIGLFWNHPPGTPIALVRAAFSCLLASYLLTAAFWARWQAKLSRDERGSESPYLAKILSTHWVRTALINAYALILLGCAWRAWGGL